MNLKKFHNLFYFWILILSEDYELKKVYFDFE